MSTHEDLGDVFAAEGLLAGEHLVDHAAKRPDVGPLVDRPPARLLRTHVRRRPENHACPRTDGGDRWRVDDVARRAFLAERLGEAEIQQLGDAAGHDLHVRGLEVAMDEPVFVRRLERVGHLACDRQDLIDRDDAGSPCPSGRHGERDHLRQRRTIDQFHDETSNTVDVLHAVQLRDVRMVQGRQRLRLALKTLQALRIAGE